MGESGGLRQWLKFGCLGCLGLVALLVIAAACVLAVVSFQVREEEVDTRELAHAPPAPAAVPGETPAAIPPAAAGKVILRLAHGGFTLAPGPPGTPLRVEARYDARTYVLEEDWQTPEGGAWTYELGFHSTVRSSLMRGLRGLLGGTSPEVHVFLPPDVPIELDLELNQAGAETELGGLWLTAADVAVNQGGLKLAVGSPLRAPLERLALRASMAGIEAVALGNASPRELELEASMGGVELDLRGAWVTDATIRIAARMGGVEVVLPGDVNVAGVDERLPGARQAEVRLPTLTFDVEEARGEVEFVER
jgi:hypothetical protein